MDRPPPARPGPEDRPPSSSNSEKQPRSSSPNHQNSTAAGSSSSHSNSTTATGGSLFGWVKTAFSSPLHQVNRTGSPASGRSSLAKWTSSSASSSPQMPPGRNLEAEMNAHPHHGLQAHTSEASSSSLRPSRFDYDSASMHSAGTSDGGADDDSDSDDEEELYEPFQPREQPKQQFPTTSSSSAAQQPSRSQAAAAPGLVRPTARRRVSLNHGSRDDDLAQDVAQLSLDTAQANDDDAASGVASLHRGVVVSDIDSKDSSIPNPPSLVLTPPDSREAAEITSPIVAGWAGQGSSPPSNNSNQRSGASSQAAPARQYSREAVALGSGSAAMRNASSSDDDDEEDDNHHQPHAPLSHTDGEDWDDARSKTPKVFSDLYRPTTIDQVMATAHHHESLDPRQAAAEIAETSAPTPRPSDPHPVAESSSPKMNVKAPTPLSPGRLRFFGNRKRTDSNAASSDGASIKEGPVSPDITPGAKSEQTQSRPPLATRTSSNTPFWRRGRKASSAAITNNPPQAGPPSRHNLEPSASQDSGLSVEVLETASDAMYMGGNDSRRASSIAVSEARSTGASSRGRSRAAKAFGLAGEAGPKKYKSRAKNKPSSQHSFANLYLAQELYLGIPTPSDKVTLESAPSSRKPSVSASSSMSASSSSDGMQRPPLASMDSESSLTSTLSSTLASSAMSHSTVGSYGAHGKKNATWAMKFSQDGRYLAVAGQDMVVRVFAVLDTAQKRDMEVQENQIRAEILRRAENRSSKDSLDANGDDQGRGSNKSSKKSAKGNSPPLKPIPVFNSRPIREFAGHISDVLSLDWSKGNFLLSSSMDKTVKIWHLSKPECLITFGHGDFVTSAVFHPKDDRFFLSGSLDGKLRLWNIAAKRVQATAEVPGLITATSFSASGSTAIAGTFAGALLFYNTDDLAYQSSIAVRSSSNKNSRGRKITGIEAVNNITPSTPTPGSKQGGVQPTKIEELILISSNDSRVRVYSLTDKRLTAKYRGHSYLNRTSQIRASSADETYVVAGSESGEVYVWDCARESAGFAATMSKKATANARRGSSGSSKNGPISSQSYECWPASDHARPITVALLAPIKAHTHLTTSEDPIELHSAIVSQGRAPSSGTTALSALGLAGAFSAAMPSTLRPGSLGAPPPPGWDPWQNRIVVSVDESQIIRVWRALRDPHVIGSAGA